MKCFKIPPSLVVFLLMGTLTHTLAEEREPPKFEASRPSEKGCRWRKLHSAESGFSIVHQECDFNFRRIGFSIEGNAVLQNYSDGDSEKLIELWDKKKSESPQEVLKRLFISNLSPYERQHCIVQRADPVTVLQSPFKNLQKSAWVIAPDEEYRREIEKVTPEGEMPAESCGTYGLPVDSRAYFEFHSYSENRFAWVIAGQDSLLFDEQSLEW